MGRMLAPVWAVHSDNGSEFISHHMFRFCEERGIQMAHGRANRKNENSRIEQKNWTHVHRVVGYWRLESKAEPHQLRELCRLISCSKSGTDQTMSLTYIMR